MKKIILTLLAGVIAYSATSKYERHNIFLGAGVGIDHQVRFDDYAFAWNIFGGYEFKPMRQIGMMAYVESLISIKPYELTTRIITQFSINIDASLEVLQINQYTRVGPYLGVGFGYANLSATFEDKTGQNKALFFTNAGLQMNVDESNVVRLGVKIPFDLGKVHTDALQVMASYAYKF